MKQFKYIETIVRISLFTIWIIYFSKIENISVLLILLAVSTDILTKLFGYFWIKSQIKQKKLIFFNNKRPFYKRLTDLIGLSLFMYFLVQIIKIGTIEINAFGTIIIVYLGIYEILFSNKINRIYFNKEGIIRPGLMELIIKWSDLVSFTLSKENITIETSKSNYSIVITKNESEKIVDFIKSEKIKVPNTVYN